MTHDEQEALSRAHSNDMIYILLLRSGNVAVFNRARELCGIIETPATLGDMRAVWFPPASPPAQRSRPTPTLEDLGL